MNMLKQTLRYLSKEMTDAEIDTFVSKCTIRKTLDRFEYLIKMGETENNLYFITKGVLRTFYVQGKEEVCELFGAPYDFYCSYASFLFQVPSTNYVQALKKTELVGINRREFHEFVKACRPMERLWRLQTEKIIVEIMERDNLLRLPAKEKVAQLLADQPTTFQLVPHKYIASYLRLTPETFSNMLRQTKS